MDKKSSKDGDSIPAQLPSQGARVLHVQDLPSHQEYDPKRKVPAGGQAETPDEVADQLGRSHRPPGREPRPPGQEPSSPGNQVEFKKSLKRMI